MLKQSEYIDDEKWRLLHRWHYKQRYATLLEQPYGKTLEIGSAQGLFTTMLAKKGIEVTGIDINKNLLDIAADTAKVNKVALVPRFRWQDVTNMVNIGTNMFDTVVCSEVLEHLEDPQLAVNEIARVCKGDVYITVPGKGKMPPSSVPGHLHDFERQFIVFMVELAGLTVTNQFEDETYSYVFSRKGVTE
jgi:2-polyprenyl-3-methyl-5-hydroxy-6-metoxy-1,4-benzoquinol methylase